MKKEAGVDFHRNESPPCLLLAFNIIILAKNNSETRIPQGPRKYYASLQELVRALFLIVCVNYSFYLIYLYYTGWLFISRSRIPDSQDS